MSGVFEFPAVSRSRGPLGEDYQLLMICSIHDAASVAWRLKDVVIDRLVAEGVFTASGKGGTYVACAEALPLCLERIPIGSKVSLLCKDVPHVFPTEFGGRGYLKDWKDKGDKAKGFKGRPRWKIVSEVMDARGLSIACCPTQTADAADDLKALKERAQESSGAEGLGYESPADKRDREFQEALERNAEPEYEQ